MFTVKKRGGKMRVRERVGIVRSIKELTKKQALIGGISSFALIAATTAGSTAINDSATQAVDNTSNMNESTKSTTKVDISNGQLNVESTTIPPENVVSESYTETGDGRSTTKQYSTTTQDQSGNTTTQEHSYTSNIDGNSAVDINLNSNSSSSNSVNSSSSVNVNVNSSSKVTSSGSD